MAFVVLMHFGKAGYVLSYLPAAALLALWPASRLARRQRLGAGIVVALVCVVDLQRFLLGGGVLPGFARDHRPWFTQGAYGAPYRVTRATIDQTDQEADAYRAIASRFDPRRDVLVYVWLDGAHRYRHAMYTMPQFTIDMVHDGVVENAGHRLRWSHPYARQLAVPEGGHAVLVLDEPRPDLFALERAGKAQEVQLETGPLVWQVDPGVTVFGVAMVPVAGSLPA
jgi:hypothetical protein